MVVPTRFFVPEYRNAPKVSPATLWRFFFLKRPFFKMIFKGSLKVFLQGFYHELPQKKIVQKFLHLFFSRLSLMESFKNSSKCCCMVFSLNSIRNFSGTLPEFLWQIGSGVPSRICNYKVSLQFFSKDFSRDSFKYPSKSL